MRALPVKDHKGIHMSILREMSRKYFCRLSIIIKGKGNKSRQNVREKSLKSKPIILSLSPDKVGHPLTPEHYQKPQIVPAAAVQQLYIVRK